MLGRQGTSRHNITQPRPFLFYRNLSSLDIRKFKIRARYELTFILGGPLSNRQGRACAHVLTETGALF